MVAPAGGVTAFLSLGTTDILDQIILGLGGGAVYCSICVYALDTRSTPLSMVVTTQNASEHC